MTAVDDVLRRLRDDAAFRRAVGRDPSIALREYPLGPDDLPLVEDAARDHPSG